ncbi:MAG: EFR1 family ferrodoxin [Prevotella sp.]
MIFYFSGTGNTLWAANHLANVTNDTLVDIGKYMFPDIKSKDISFCLKKDERIGFCFPTHGWQPPGIVRSFIRQLNLTTAGGHYCYALTTCGDNIGETMSIFRRELVKKNIHLDACFSLMMPESYVALPFMYTDTIENERLKRSKAIEDLVGYEKIIATRKKDECHILKGPLPWFFSYIVGSFFNKRMISDKKFTVDTDKCITCGQCVKACPVNDICLTDGKPRWKHDNRCTTCLACYHHCPRHAINYGRITRKRGQYYFGRNDKH